MLKAGDNEGSTIKMASDTHAFHVYCTKTRDERMRTMKKKVLNMTKHKMQISTKGSPKMPVQMPKLACVYKSIVATR